MASGKGPDRARLLAFGLTSLIVAFGAGYWVGNGSGGPARAETQSTFEEEMERLHGGARTAGMCGGPRTGCGGAFRPGHMQRGSGSGSGCGAGSGSGGNQMSGIAANQCGRGCCARGAL